VPEMRRQTPRCARYPTTSTLPASGRRRFFPDVASRRFPGCLPITRNHRTADGYRRVVDQAGERGSGLGASERAPAAVAGVPDAEIPDHNARPKTRETDLGAADDRGWPILRYTRIDALPQLINVPR
jgi:hypothetical protein